MQLLLKAALKQKKHFALLVVTALSLIGLTVAEFMEVFTLGILTSSEDSAFQKKNPLSGVIKWLSKHISLHDSQIETLLALIILVACVKAVMLFYSRFATQLLAIRVSRDLREQYFQHIQSLPMGFYHEYNIGSLSSRIVGDASQIAQSLNSFIVNYIHSPFTIVTTLSACFILSWQLSLVIFVGIPLVMLPVIFLTRKVKRITRLLQKRQEGFSSVLIDFLSGIQTVKIFGMEQFSTRKYVEQNSEMAELETKTAKYDLLTRPILHTITSFCLAFILLFGIYVLNMEVSSLFMFSALIYKFYEPVKKFAEENMVIQKGVVASERMFEVLDVRPDISDRKDARTLTDFKERITFEDVWFRYKDEWILKGVSFDVQKGETVAIVGATGAGKSTIVNLLPRLYEVQKGNITIDGYNLKDVTQQSLRTLMGFVSQKPFLFYDTIASNIMHGEVYPEEAVIAAAEKAHAHEFIEKLPDGYATKLQETGKNLSGGQQQRVAIARALIKKAPILIFDEATSALDGISEQKIKEAILSLQGEVTQILIAHRLSTIEHADKIIVLEDGVKIGEGKKDELLESCPAFAAMWHAHFQTKAEEAAL